MNFKRLHYLLVLLLLIPMMGISFASTKIPPIATDQAAQTVMQHQSVNTVGDRDCQTACANGLSMSHCSSCSILSSNYEPNLIAPQVNVLSPLPVSNWHSIVCAPKLRPPIYA